MRIYAILSVCAVLMLGLVAPAHAEFYRWVDKDGKEFYTNEKEKIPAEYRGSAKPVEVRDDRVSVGKSPVGTPSPAGAVSDHKDKYGRSEEYWRKRAENLRRQIREKEDDLDIIVKQERRDEKRSSNSSSRTKSKKSSVSSRDKKKAALEKKIGRLKRELEVELPEEARKADAYPGWLRE